MALFPVEDLIVTDEEKQEWVALLARLRAVSPRKVREVMRLLTGIVEGQELIASLDDLLVFRPARPSKRYRA